MFSEILKIKPRLDNSDLNKMDSQLSKRFMNISKKFGKGLVAALAGGGAAGLALGFIDKILNPLKDVQESIDRTLKNADDVVTMATRFQTTPGKLFKLEQAAVATGLESNTLFSMIEKFQTAVAEAKADPTKQTSVRQFTEMPDTAEAFLKFIQAMKALPQAQQSLVQNEIFGERLVLKAADFVQSDFKQLFLRMNAKGSEEYTQSLVQLGELADATDILNAARNLRDIQTKSKLITNATVSKDNEMKNLALSRENQKIGGYQGLAALSISVDKTIAKLEQQIIPLLNSIAPALTKLGNMVDKIPTLRGLRGLTDGKGK